MKYKPIQVLNLHGVLAGADSRKGQARKFIRINGERFQKAYVKSVVGWIDDNEHEYEALTVQRGQDGKVAGWHFAGGEGSEGHEAFMDFLRDGEEVEVEPYAMTESVLDDIDEIDRQGHAMLRLITIEGIAEIQASEEADNQETDEEE